jgi:ParB family chromosome partitioning protein
MATAHAPGTLANIQTTKIQPNPDNPRLTFRQGELDELQESIRQYGIQVPIAVYKKGTNYVLIDGERRWRCASKLNLKTIPALIQSQPDPLANLLLMFNIHALREQWDLLTIALKLPKIIDLIVRETNRQPTEAELSTRTGLTRGVIRRCRLLMDLPEKYKSMLLGELKKPKAKQLLSEDLFIEMERSLKTAARAMPDVVTNIDTARDVLVKKYKDKVIDNIVDFRKVAKIARATIVGVKLTDAQTAIKRLLTEPRYSITQAWQETASEAYAERDIVSRIDSLMSKLDEVGSEAIDDEVKEKLEELIRRAEGILRAAT